MAVSVGGSLSMGVTDTTNKTSGYEQSKESISRLSDESYNLTKRMAQLFGKELDDADGLTREQAIADTRNIVSNMFQNFKDTALPEIFSAQTRTGSFNSTTGQMLADNAFARTNAEASGVVQQAVKDYETLAQERRKTSIAGLQTALNAEVQGRESKKTSSAFETRSRTKSTSFAASVKGSFGF